MPSPLKSAVTSADPEEVGFGGNCVKVMLPAGLETSTYCTFDVPPPGAGFDTVTVAVPGTAMSVAGTAAVNWELLTKVVVRIVPLQLTADAETNPVPFTVSVKAGPPGAVVVGTNG